MEYRSWVFVLATRDFIVMFTQFHFHEICPKPSVIQHLHNNHFKILWDKIQFICLFSLKCWDVPLLQLPPHCSRNVFLFSICFSGVFLVFFGSPILSVCLICPTLSCSVRCQWRNKFVKPCFLLETMRNYIKQKRSFI